MNRYGLHARRRWTEIDPERAAAIPNPQEFFSELGEQILIQVTNLADAILAKEPARESVLEREAQIAMATRTAEEIVFGDLVEIEPPEEYEEPDWDAFDQSVRKLEDDREWMPDWQYDQEKAKLEEIRRTGRLPKR